MKYTGYIFFQLLYGSLAYGGFTYDTFVSFENSGDITDSGIASSPESLQFDTKILDQQQQQQQLEDETEADSHSSKNCLRPLIEEIYYKNIEFAKESLKIAKRYRELNRLARSLAQQPKAERYLPILYKNFNDQQLIEADFKIKPELEKRMKLLYLKIQQGKNKIIANEEKLNVFIENFAKNSFVSRIYQIKNRYDAKKSTKDLLSDFYELESTAIMAEHLRKALETYENLHFSLMNFKYFVLNKENLPIRRSNDLYNLSKEILYAFEEVERAFVSLSNYLDIIKFKLTIR